MACSFYLRENLWPTSIYTRTTSLVQGKKKGPYHLQGDPNQNLVLQLAIAQKLCTFDSVVKTKREKNPPLLKHILALPIAWYELSN